MERKFVSELGREVAEGKRRHSKKVLIAAASAVTCAFLFGSAAFLLPVLAAVEQAGMPVNWLPIMPTDDDYIIYNQDDGYLHYEEWTVATPFEVKRSATLKVTEFDQSNSDNGNVYNKFVYSMGVNAQSLYYLETWDRVVGKLTIPFVPDNAEDVPEFTITMYVNDKPAKDVDMVDTTFDAYDPETPDDDKAIVVEVKLGQYETVGDDGNTIVASVTDGDSLSIQVMIKTPFYADLLDGVGDEIEDAVADLGVEETAFPGVSDVEI